MTREEAKKHLVKMGENDLAMEQAWLRLAAQPDKDGALMLRRAERERARGMRILCYIRNEGVITSWMRRNITTP